MKNADEYAKELCLALIDKSIRVKRIARESATSYSEDNGTFIVTEENTDIHYRVNKETLRKDTGRSVIRKGFLDQVKEKIRNNPNVVIEDEKDASFIVRTRTYKEDPFVFTNLDDLKNSDDDDF